MTRPRAPRRVFWALLTCALLVSFAFPLATLWHISTSGMSARACMWPAEPRAGDVAQALVVVPATAAASETSEATAGALVVQVVATMPAMRMAAEHATATLPPQPLHGATVFSAPITITMPGLWEARFTAQLMGRPIWNATVAFHASVSSWGTLPLSTQAMGAAQPCAPSTTPQQVTQQSYHVTESG